MRQKCSWRANCSTQEQARNFWCAGGKCGRFKNGAAPWHVPVQLDQSAHPSSQALHTSPSQGTYASCVSHDKEQGHDNGSILQTPATIKRKYLDFEEDNGHQDIVATLSTEIRRLQNRLSDEHVRLKPVIRQVTQIKDTSGHDPTSAYSDLRQLCARLQGISGSRETEKPNVAITPVFQHFEGKSANVILAMIRALLTDIAKHTGHPESHLMLDFLQARTTVEDMLKSTFVDRIQTIPVLDNLVHAFTGHPDRFIRK